MQATLDIPISSPSPVNEDTALRAAQVYLAGTLGADYVTTRGFYKNGCWEFLIRYHHPDVQQPCVVGRIVLDAQTGRVIPLTLDQLREIHECAAWEVARLRGELARDAEGYVSRHEARRLARRWLDQQLSMKYSASGGLLIPLDPPVWQFSIEFRLQEFCLEPLGIIDVDALSGTVKPLSDEQLETLRERVRAVIKHRASRPEGPRAA
jgi:hypothetical protein